MAERTEPCADLRGHSGQSQQEQLGPDGHELVETKPSGRPEWGKEEAREGEDRR